MQFDRERIPERVVHARGASAKGFFEVWILDLDFFSLWVHPSDDAVKGCMLDLNVLQSAILARFPPLYCAYTVSNWAC